jgi:hypothetical protein
MVYGVEEAISVELEGTTVSCSTAEKLQPVFGKINRSIAK